MHWSKTSTRGSVSNNLIGLRSHTATVLKHKLILLGGCDAKDNFHDITIFDTDVHYFYKPVVSGEVPNPRRAHSANLVDRHIFIFGGGDGPNYFNDLWKLDTSTFTWSKCSAPTSSPSTAPCPRRAHISETVNKKIYYFGGGDGAQALGDVYTLDPDILKWNQVKTRGVSVAGRGYHRSALIGKAIYVFGGSDGKTCFNDMNFLDTSTHTWHGVKVQDGPGLLSHSSAVIGDKYIAVFGGHNSSSFVSDFKLFDIRTSKWITPRFTGATPCTRGYHTLTMCDYRLWSIGGFDGATAYDDVHSLDIGYYAYHEVAPPAPPLAPSASAPLGGVGVPSSPSPTTPMSMSPSPTQMLSSSPSTTRHMMM